MHAKYPNVFSPIRLGAIEVPTRFYFAPHGSALSAGLKPSDDLVAYSAERVTEGGCGLVIVSLVLHKRGDALDARPLAAATYEGQKFARLIGEPGAPATVCETYFRPDDSNVMFVAADASRGIV